MSNVSRRFEKSRKLNSNQMKELRQAFELFDVDGSGNISVNELKQALNALGVRVTDQEARQLFNAIDVDKNGRIEFDEFAEMVAEFYFKKFSRAEILEAFRRFDHNHDGFIEAHELKQIFTQLGRNFTSDEIHRMIAQVDRDGNGKISIEEFAALVEKDV